jgi:hypothetical protein
MDVLWFPFTETDPFHSFGDYDISMEYHLYHTLLDVSFIVCEPSIILKSQGQTALLETDTEIKAL